jgi:hypothetical protein
MEIGGRVLPVRLCSTASCTWQGQDSVVLSVARTTCFLARRSFDEFARDGKKGSRGFRIRSQWLQLPQFAFVPVADWRPTHAFSV